MKPDPSPAGDVPLTYAQAGVDTAAADDAIAALTPHARSTYRPEVLSDIGAFASVTALPDNYEQPVLVTANDGAGTKTMIAHALGCYDSIGIDVVAMCVDDIVTLGAEPLLFQNQITMESVDSQVVAELVKGMAAGCLKAGCALTGGEIAEHPAGTSADPNSNSPDPLNFDVCGFAVGVAERQHIPQPLLGDSGAVLIGLESPNLRCNGFSLARRALLGERALNKARLCEPAWEGANHSLGEELLKPSVIYAPAVLAMFREAGALAAAHITGGGLAANLARILSPSADAVVRRGSWQRPRIFDEIAKAGPVAPAEMEAVFNLGIGMVMAVPPPALEAAEIATRFNLTAWEIGKIVPGSGKVHLTSSSD